MLRILLCHLILVNVLASFGRRKIKILVASYQCATSAIDWPKLVSKVTQPLRRVGWKTLRRPTSLLPTPFMLLKKMKFSLLKLAVFWYFISILIVPPPKKFRITFASFTDVLRDFFLTFSSFFYTFLPFKLCFSYCFCSPVRVYVFFRHCLHFSSFDRSSVCCAFLQSLNVFAFCQI